MFLHHGAFFKPKGPWPEDPIAEEATAAAREKGEASSKEIANSTRPIMAV